MMTPLLSAPSRFVPLLFALVLTGASCSKSSSSGVPAPPGGGGGGGPAPLSQPLLVDFGLRTDLHLGTAFLGDVHHVDLDGDGIQDLVEGNFGTNFVTVAFGEADGSFRTALEIPTVGHSWKVTTGDMNGDGNLDIAVACTSWIDGAQAAVQVFEQTPGGRSFLGAKTFNLAGNPRDLIALPISGNVADSTGPEELFVSVRERREVLRLQLDASGQLAQTGVLESSATGAVGSPYSLAGVDLGADGIYDLVVGEVGVDGGASDRIVEYPRTAAGFQAARAVFAPAFAPIVDSVGDVDGDGFDDIAVAQFEDTEVHLLAPNSSGIANGRVVSLDFGGETTSLLFTDLDGDGLREAVATVFDQNSIQVRRATGPLVWDEPVHYNVGVGPRALGVLQLPGDTVPDLLCANSQDLSILLGVGNAEFRGARGYATGTEPPVVLELADMDNDGDLDAVGITRRQQSLLLMEGRGDGTLHVQNVRTLTPADSDELGFVTLADIDRDGMLDVVATVFSRDELRVYRNPGRVADFTDPRIEDIVAVGDGPTGFELCDVNGDLYTDIVVSNKLAGTLQVLEGGSGGTFTAQPAISLGGLEPLTVLCTDLDDDGNVDAAVAAVDPTLGHCVAILAGDGEGGFTQAVVLDVTGAIGDLDVGDFNADGLADVVVGQVELSVEDVHVFLNSENFTFTASTIPAAPGPGAVVVADADADGHLDLLVSTTAGELRMLFGDGTGAFPESAPDKRGAMPVPEDTFSVSYGDLNGDRLPELLFVSRRSPFVWVAINTSVALED